MRKIQFAGMAIVTVLLCMGCGIAEGPREKLKQSSFAFNEGLRWGRYNDVLPIVDSQALDHFTEIHQGWGDSLLVSNAEIIQTVYDDKERKAIITVKFTWYRKKEMVVHSTVTNQHWEYRDAKWWMMAEEYQSGEPF